MGIVNRSVTYLPLRNVSDFNQPGVCDGIGLTPML
jgi:hypothetical protein